MQGGMLGFPDIEQEYDARHRIVVNEITTAGAGTFEVPDGVHQIEFDLGGAGGGGGGANTDLSAGGGGGHGRIKRGIMKVNPGQRIPYNVGTGGGDGAANAGGDGGNTTFGNETAEGGKGGRSANNTHPFGVGGLSGGGTGGHDAAVPAYFSGAGGSTEFGLGGASVAGTANGNNGTGNTSGGSGAVVNIATNRTGGSGAPGIIRLRWRSPDRQRVPKL